MIMMKGMDARDRKMFGRVSQFFRQLYFYARRVLLALQNAGWAAAAIVQ